MVYCPCPGEPSGDSYIVESVGSIDGKFAQTTLALCPSGGTAYALVLDTSVFGYLGSNPGWARFTEA